jgi:DNA-binding LytR/AlgR family response regulator
MLMCRKAAHKNLIDGSPLFPCNKKKAIYNLHMNDIILLEQSKGKVNVYAP